jgi:hypothetical protein
MVVWPNILEMNPTLWENGNFVSITGEVRDRFGRVSISVETASEYQLKNEGQAESEAENAKNEPAPVIRAGFNEASEPRPVLNDPVQNMRPPVQPQPDAQQVAEIPKSTYNNPVQSTDEPERKETPLTIDTAAPTENYVDDNGMSEGGGPVLVRVKETGDAADDRYRLEDIMRLFVEFPGPDSAILEIETGAKIVRLDMPFHVQAGTQLTKRLHELLGNGAVRTVVV